MSFKEFTDYIKEHILKYLPEQELNVSQFMDFQQVKDHITCKLINKKENEWMLADMPYTTMEDLAVTYQLTLGWKGHERGASIPIQNKMLEAYGIDIPELHHIALENTRTLFPAKLSSIQDSLMETLLPDFMEENGLDKDEAETLLQEMFTETVKMKLYVLTNDTRLYGAAAILDPHLLKDISEELGGDFYVLPSSVHEVLITPKTEALAGYKELEKIVREVNETMLGLEDVLSDKVYEYDAKAHELFRSDKAAERKESLAQNRGKTPMKEKLSAMKEKSEALNQRKAGTVKKDKNNTVDL